MMIPGSSLGCPSVLQPIFRTKVDRIHMEIMKARIFHGTVRSSCIATPLGGVVANAFMAFACPTKKRSRALIDKSNPTAKSSFLQPECASFLVTYFRKIVRATVSNGRIKEKNEEDVKNVIMPVDLF